MLPVPVLGEGLRRYPTAVVDSQAERMKTALCLPGARPEPGAPSQPLLAGFLRSRAGLGCSWSASDGDGGSGGRRQSGSGARGGGALARASAGSTCRARADAAGSAAQGRFLLLQRAARRGAAWRGGGVGGGPNRAQTLWVIWSVELRGLGVQARVASGSLCSASASFWELRKEKSCAWRRGWCVTQREAGGAGR